MALAVNTDLASILAEVFDEQITSQINRSVVALKVVPHEYASGQALVYDAETSNVSQTTPTLADGADVSAYEDVTITKAKLDFGTYSLAFGVSGKAMAAARSSNSPKELLDLMLVNLKVSAQKQAKSLNKDFYLGAGGNAMLGVLATAGGFRAAGTYATIVRGTVTSWAGNEIANGGTPRALTIALMHTALNAAYTACGEFPNVILMHPDTFVKYGNLLRVANSYMEFDNVNIDGRIISIDGGYTALRFCGIPVLADPDCPNHTVIFMNTNYVSIAQMADGATADNRGTGLITLAGSPEKRTGMGGTALTSRINPLSMTGDKAKLQLLCYPQVKVTRPNAHAILTDIDPAL